MGSTVSLSDSFALCHPAEAGHAARVTELALRIARALGVAAAPTEAIALGGPLHDLGKLAVDDAILRKPGPLPADAYDALVPERPYPAALARDAALVEVGRCSGTQFDPTVASAFLSLDGLRAAS